MMKWISVIALQILVWIFYQLLPESARYLVAAGEKDRALHILQKAAKINKSSLPKGRLTVAHSVRSHTYTASILNLKANHKATVKQDDIVFHKNGSLYD